KQRPHIKNASAESVRLIPVNCGSPHGDRRTILHKEPPAAAETLIVGDTRVIDLHRAAGTHENAAANLRVSATDCEALESDLATANYDNEVSPASFEKCAPGCDTVPVVLI